MSADTASTLEKRDVVQGAQILAATLGDAHEPVPTPPPPPRRLPSGFEDAMKAAGPVTAINDRADAPEKARCNDRNPSENHGQIAISCGSHFAGAPGCVSELGGTYGSWGFCAGLSVNRSGSLQVRQMKTMPVVIVTIPQPSTSISFGCSARP